MRRPLAQETEPEDAKRITFAHYQALKAGGLPARHAWIIVRRPGIQVWQPGDPGCPLQRVWLCTADHAKLEQVEREWGR